METQSYKLVYRVSQLNENLVITEIHWSTPNGPNGTSIDSTRGERKKSMALLNRGEPNHFKWYLKLTEPL